MPDETPEDLGDLLRRILDRPVDSSKDGDVEPPPLPEDDDNDWSEPWLFSRRDGPVTIRDLEEETASLRSRLSDLQEEMERHHTATARFGLTIIEAVGNSIRGATIWLTFVMFVFWIWK